MTDEKDEALFTGRGPLSDDLARLERALSALPLPPEPDWSAGRSRSPRPPILLWAAAATVLLVAAAGLLFGRDAWRVETLAGSPSLGGVAFAGRIATGGRVVTDSHSRARLEVKGLGLVELGPGSVLRRVRGEGPSVRMLALDRGSLAAYIQAPPRRFVVATPVGVATDLGCAYTLSMAPDGRGRLGVTLGRVTFTRDGRESFVPAGLWCPLLPSGAGVPRRDYASDAFLAAIAAYDSAPGDAAALDHVLEAAVPDDAITLWHLLPRVSGVARARVAARMAALIAVPADVTLERVLALEPAALDAWWDAIGFGPAAEWRATSPKQALPLRRG
jgi:hypothetical protein